MIDMSGSEGRDPIDDYHVINKELVAYKQRLEDRPQIIVANKMDMPDAEDNLELFKEEIGDDHIIIPLSAVSRDNIDQLLYTIADQLEKLKILISLLKKMKMLV